MKNDIWQGRIDDYEEGPCQRWHQVIHPLDQMDQPGIAILGICSDEGVRRNQGRQSRVVAAAGGAEGHRRAEARHKARWTATADHPCP